MNTQGRRRSAAVGTSLAALAALALPAADAREADSAALEEVWRTDFEGPAGSLPAGEDWIIDTGTSYEGGPPNWGTGETQTYTDDPANIQLDGEGHLKITALKDGGTWTSGRIETQRTDFAAPEGGVLRIEAGIQLPDVSGDAALGYWPAFWALGEEYRGDYFNWPGIGELDVMENVNGLGRTFAVLHCGVNPGGPCNETEGISGSTECDGCSTGFHTYALELDRTGSTEFLRWYLDGEEFHSVSSADMDARTWADATHHGYFVLLNLAMGGALPNAIAGKPTPTDTTEPGGFLLVDHVSVRQSGG
jgi:beta-glucanase (GH16 family)